MLVASYDYMINATEQRGIHSYMSRRWDLASILGSTGISVLFGLVSGYLLRFWILRGSITFIVDFDRLILACSLLLVYIFLDGCDRVLKEDVNMSICLIESGENAKLIAHLKAAFPR